MREGAAHALADRRRPRGSARRRDGPATRRNDDWSNDMAEISASMVMELRQRTGLGMMECKKALTEAGGDSRRPRSSCASRAARRRRKAAGRIAAEGVIGAVRRAGREDRRDGRSQLRDRLRREERRLQAFAAEVAQIVARDNPADVAALGDAHARFGRDGRGAPRRRSCRRSARTCRSAASRDASPRARSRPTCTAVRIGVLVDVDRRRRRARQGPRDAHRGDASRWRVSQATACRADVDRAKERAIAAAQAAESGKPANIVEKMVEGARQQVPGRSHAARPAVRQGRRQADGRASS